MGRCAGVLRYCPSNNNGATEAADKFKLNFAITNKLLGKCCDSQFILAGPKTIMVIYSASYNFYY
jgi:hypothetical protein